MCENMLLASELVVDFHKAGPTSRGCIQFDITKAYDNVNWSFIVNILKAFQLPETFISWIHLCISTPYYSIALNGEHQGFFTWKKGLRQRDPISPSLFILSMDLLSKDLDLAVTYGRFCPHPLCLDPLITHISFADDVLIFLVGTRGSLVGILDVLRSFQSVSGLALNIRNLSFS